MSYLKRHEDDHPERTIERGRFRLLALGSVLLVAFAALSVILSIVGQDLLEHLSVAPQAARWGVLILALAFVLLVWEKELKLSRLSSDLRSERIIAASFRNRLDVVESLLDASDQLNAPLTVHEVVRLLLDASIEMTGAIGGNVSLFAEEGSKVELTESQLPALSPDRLPETKEIVIPLEHANRLVARLTLLIPVQDLRSEKQALEVLDRLAGQAAATLQRARAMDDQRASFAYLQAAHTIKSRFLATVSHELRTPLTSIIGYTSTLEHHWERLTEREKREALTSVHRQSHTLWRLVERILEAARVELEGITVNPVEHDVTRSVRNALQSFLDTDARRLRIDIPLDPVLAEVDPVIVEQCLWNLVDNGLRYTDDLVSISIEEDPESLRIKVIDRGVGVDPARVDKAHDPLSLREEDPSAGTGLGLHVVHTLMSDHGGSLTFSRGAPGTVATLQFPRWVNARGTTRSPRYMRGDVSIPPKPLERNARQP